MTRIATNISSIQGQRYLEQNRRSDDQLSFNLSSGQRIYQAADDPAGLAISEKLKSQTRSNDQAKRNTNDGLSLIQVTEGALSVIHDIGGRLKELAMQASTDTLSDEQRIVMNEEFKHMKEEVRRLTESTKFNGKLVLKGDDSVYDLQIGIRNTPKNDRLSYRMKDVLANISDLKIMDARIDSKFSAQRAIGQVGTMIEKISSSRSHLGSTANRLESVMQNLMVSNENLSSGNSRIRDADMADVTSRKATGEIRLQASAAMLAQSNFAPSGIKKLLE